MSVQLREFTSASAPPGMSLQDGQIALPPEPTSIAETGLGMGFLTDLALKVIYFHGNISAQQVSEVTKLPFLGVLVYLLVNGDEMGARRMRDVENAQSAFDDHIRTVSGGAAGEIERAKGLLDSGAITQAEFDAIKAKALA